jgi:hypothetical protein
MRATGYVARIRKVRNAQNILIEKPGGKSPLGRHRRRKAVILEYVFWKEGGK